jgi:hypothetical protein
VAKSLAKRRVIESAEVKKADDAALEQIAQALECPKEMVIVQIGGTCTLEADWGRRRGWKLEFKPEHIIEDADAEVELILKHLKDSMASEREKLRHYIGTR